MISIFDKSSTLGGLSDSELNFTVPVIKKIILFTLLTINLCAFFKYRAVLLSYQVDTSTDQQQLRLTHNNLFDIKLGGF